LFKAGLWQAKPQKQGTRCDIANARREA